MPVSACGEPFSVIKASILARFSASTTKRDLLVARHHLRCPPPCARTSSQHRRRPPSRWDAQRSPSRGPTHVGARPSHTLTFMRNVDVYGREATWLPHSAAPCETRPRPTFRQVMEAIAAASRPRLGVSRAPRLRPLHERAQFGAKIGGPEREVASAQGWDGKARLHGFGTSRWPRRKAEVLVLCAVHVCERRDSMEV